MKARATLLLALLVGCASTASPDQGIAAYRQSRYQAALDAFAKLDGNALSERDQARHLVYRGLAHYRLGQREQALQFLMRGSQAVRIGQPDWLPADVVQQAEAALADLSGNTAGPLVPR